MKLVKRMATLFLALILAVGMTSCSSGSNDTTWAIKSGDDVISTGATLDECAKMLRLAGAKTVYAAGVCLAKKHAEPEEAEETNSQNSI